MVDVVVTGHGGRGVGTSVGSYVVPRGVTIYFFTPDQSVLYAGASDILMDNLCVNHPRAVAVRNAAVDVKTEYETVPNYVCYGTNDFRDASGVYRVGAARTVGPMVAIPNGTKRRLSEIIGGSGNGIIGSRIYWLCCRAAPDNSNNIDDSADIVTGNLTTGDEIGAVEVASSMGLTPSQVRRTGQWR